MKTWILILLSLFSLSSSAFEEVEDFFAPEVSQREYMLAKSSTFKSIQTNGLSTCVALVIFSKKQDLTFMAHIDQSVELEKFLDYSFSYFKEADLEVSLLGGVKGSTNLNDDIFDLLNDRNIKIKNRFTSEDHFGINIGIDTLSGEVFFHNNSVQSTDYSVGNAKTKRLMMISKKMFSHQDSLYGGESLEFFMEEESGATIFRPTF